MEGPLIGGTCLAGATGARSATTGRGATAGTFAGFGCEIGREIGACETGGCEMGAGGDGIGGRGSDMGAVIRRGGSSKVPHIPQKRKLSALSSPHFGQVKVALRMS
jgi:hypothetical protein